MKVHYKSVLLNPNKKDDEEEMWYRPILEEKHKYCIDFCCDDMRSAFDTYTKVFDIMQHDIYLYDVIGDYGSSYSVYYHKVNYCPFCGEKIEFIEEYKAKKQKYKATIPRKVTPPRTEYRNREVRISEAPNER